MAILNNTMLINLSNHPLNKWSHAQIEAALRYGKIIDLPFPAVKADGDEAYISDLADEYVRKVLSLSDGEKSTIHLMGEMTLTFAILKRLQERGFRCIASTSERLVEDLAQGHKEVIFQFVRFRDYPS